MEHLTKHQIVLLTLLVSFVTSIATGIVVVSLSDQAAPGVTQTINRVVERTIERVVSSPAAAVTATESFTLQQAIDKVSKSIVRLKTKSGDAGTVTGTGLVLTKEGVVIADKATASTPDLFAVFPDGKEFPLQVIQSQILGDIIFFAALAPRDYAFQPVTSPRDITSMKLGEALYALGGKELDTLAEGLLLKLRTKVEDDIETSISSRHLLPGSPLFTLEGEVIGLKTSSLLESTSFYSVALLKSVAPMISR